ncbi:hypothetical protein AP064_03880 [Candidatus Liberibacter solanacearum]|uniref:Uncharacterized protein n=1 Tax=Candidatus Liberibacter solanacearum TaxID=556287 RepID=A0A0F4VJI7_9HYPH|nr:hypothetical protein DJ66_0375 [Candidatus Liberibacter solanacearum]KQC48928.1 hypothetical protein AP064_03880 [Candidatus Liberibacter solanacearum]
MILTVSLLSSKAMIICDPTQYLLAMPIEPLLPLQELLFPLQELLFPLQELLFPLQKLFLPILLEILEMLF